MKTRPTNRWARFRQNFHRLGGCTETPFQSHGREVQRAVVIWVHTRWIERVRVRPEPFPLPMRLGAAGLAKAVTA